MFPLVGTVYVYIYLIWQLRWLEIYHWSFLIIFMVLVWLLDGVKRFPYSIFDHIYTVCSAFMHYRSLTYVCSFENARNRSYKKYIDMITKVYVEEQNTFYESIVFYVFIFFMRKQVALHLEILHLYYSPAVSLWLIYED